MTSTALKDWYNLAFFEQLCRDFEAAYPSFPSEKFMTLIFDEAWPARSLKERMRHITASLHEILPANYSESIEILKKVAPKTDKFLGMFFPDFVETYGLQNWKISIPALAYFTQYGSSEFAVRPFIEARPTEMMQQMLAWAKHENHHVRRLASEGCRPLLPWGRVLRDLKANPAPIFPILELLKNDESEYVRRSVANNLNDIAKNQPKQVIEIATRWYGDNENTDKLVKHACRTLLKKANPEALRLFGFGSTEFVKVFDLALEKASVQIGEKLYFSFFLENIATYSQKLRLEYRIDYVKKSGNTSPKIFQIKEKTYEAGSKILIKRSQSFQNFTTRKHYAGRHQLTIVVNGVAFENVSFDVIQP
ncbi:MAG: DNA alkylation repair protein [Chitinophagales bacterium]